MQMIFKQQLISQPNGTEPSSFFYLIFYRKKEHGAISLAHLFKTQLF